MSPVGKKLVLESLVKVRVRVRVRQVEVMVRIRVNLQEINVSLCNVPKIDHDLIYVCVFMHICTCAVICVQLVMCWDGCVLQILCFDESNQRLVIRTVVFIGDGSGIVHGRPGLLAKSGVADGGDGVAELTVDAAAVVELLVGVA